MQRAGWLGLVLLSSACSSSTPTVTPAPPVVLAHPPADPGGPPPDPASAADVSVFAVHTLYFGDVDPSTGDYDPTAWKGLGFDIDGADTTLVSEGVCQLALGASKVSQEDGHGGIDNGFGLSILPILTGDITAEFSSRANDSISAGLMTNLIVVHGLGSATTASPVAAALVLGAPLGATPTWSTADVWPVDSSSLLDLDAGSPLLAFPQSYEVAGVVLAEPPSGNGEIALGVVNGIPFVLPIRHVVIEMTLSADGMTATSGTISGIVPTDRLVELGQNVAGTVSTSLCTGSAFQSLAQQIEQASDILLDGTTDPSQPCSGISIGLGFEAVRVQTGPVAVVPPFGGVCAAVDAGP